MVRITKLIGEFSALRVVSSHFLPPARCDLPTRERENGLCQRKTSTKVVFPFSRGENRISQGVENRGSLISVPLALREFILSSLLLVPHAEQMLRHPC